MSQSLEHNEVLEQITPLVVPSCEVETDVIQQLDDEPNDVGGLTAQELKAKFDQSVDEMKDYINDDLIPTLIAADATEQARAEAEAERVANEIERVANETARVSAETSRASAETTRISNETSRSTAEATRLSNESSRVSAETARSSAESSRASAESGRASAESDRVSAESTRVSNESSRVSAETARASAETLRISAETTRGTNESTRQSNESSRTSAESTRVSNESTRQSNESTRQSNETTRANNEATRQDNESTRYINEVHRMEDESSRQYQEQARCSAEEYRGYKDTVRTAAETARETAETGRVSAESARVTAENARNVFETFDVTHSYVVGNKVAYQGSSYVCTVNSTGNLPTDTTHWLMIARKGNDGTGTGDMLKATYDSDSSVENAGGIKSFFNTNKNVFDVTYNTTSFSDICNAINAGKTPVCICTELPSPFLVVPSPYVCYVFSEALRATSQGTAVITTIYLTAGVEASDDNTKEVIARMTITKDNRGNTVYTLDTMEAKVDMSGKQDSINVTTGALLKQGSSAGSVVAATEGTDYGTYSKPSGGIPDSDIASASTWNAKVTANSTIIGATKCKITYDSKGLITSGSDLSASDIPSLNASKITSGTFADERIASASTWNAKSSKSSVITGMLNKDDWSDNQQVLVFPSGTLPTSGYAYIVSPESQSFRSFASSQVYADDVTIADQMTFHCDTVPQFSLNVVILKQEVV